MRAVVTIAAWLRRRFRRGRERHRSRPVALLLLASHVGSVALLLFVLNAALVNEKITPYYGWVRDTWLERIGLYASAQIREQYLLWRRRFLERPLGRDEEQARTVLRERIAETRPTHQVLLRDGTMIFGRLTDSPANGLVLSYLGDGGRVRRRLDPGQVRHVRELRQQPIELTARDVRFLLDYPGYEISLLPPYLFVHDTSFQLVLQAYGVLQDLATEFRAVFGDLIDDAAAGKKVYVCFFQDETTYQQHAAQREDVDLERSVGFYSQLDDCLFLYDRLQSFARTRMDRHLDRYVAELEQLENAPPAAAIRQFVATERKRLYQQLRGEVLTTLRHEGAHQLAFALGLHSAEGYERLWLEEGLAQYLETRPPGAPVASRLELLAHGSAAGELIPWQELIDTPTPRGFSYYGDRYNYAYAQSWLLFCFLMEPEPRPLFMRYLERVRALHVADLGRPRSELFEETLKRSPAALGAALEARLLQSAGAAASRVKSLTR